MDNLIFIGLPGCGKSTIGAMVAKALALPFTMRISSRNVLLVKPFPTCLKKGKLIFGQGKQKRFVSFAKRIAASFLAAAVL